MPRADPGLAPARAPAVVLGREGSLDREPVLDLGGVRPGGEAGAEMMSSQAMTPTGDSPGCSAGPTGATGSL